MVDLLLQQPYLAGVIADSRWSLTPPDDWKAPELPQQYDRVYHLGYRGWPTLPLPEQIFQNLWLGIGEQMAQENHPYLSLDLQRPWITVKPRVEPTGYVVGWTDCHFELKYGLSHLVTDFWLNRILAAPGSRWVTEAHVEPVSWLVAAECIAAAPLLLGDCSALHVLACAIGKPVVCYEPMEARHNPIFYPYGQDGPQVTLVRGLDGKPTTDSRHTAETLQKVLHAR